MPPIRVSPLRRSDCRQISVDEGHRFSAAGRQEHAHPRGEATHGLARRAPDEAASHGRALYVATRLQPRGPQRDGHTAAPTRMGRGAWVTQVAAARMLRYRLRMTVIAAILAALLAGVVAADRGFPADLLIVGPSGSSGMEDLPQGWQHVGPNNTVTSTRYRMVREAGADVLQAESRASASGLYRPLEVDPMVYRVMAWRWKVQKVVGQSGRAGEERHRLIPRRSTSSSATTRRGPRSGSACRYGAYRTLVRGVPRRRRAPLRLGQSVAPGDGPRRPRREAERRHRAPRRTRGHRSLGRGRAQRLPRTTARRSDGSHFPSSVLGVMTNADDGDDTAVAWYGQIVTPDPASSGGSARRSRYDSRHAPSPRSRSSSCSLGRVQQPRAAACRSDSFPRATRAPDVRCMTPPPAGSPGQDPNAQPMFFFFCMQSP